MYTEAVLAEVGKGAEVPFGLVGVQRDIRIGQEQRQTMPGVPEALQGLAPTVVDPPGRRCQFPVAFGSDLIEYPGRFPRGRRERLRLLPCRDPSAVAAVQPPDPVQPAQCPGQAVAFEVGEVATCIVGVFGLGEHADGP